MTDITFIIHMLCTHILELRFAFFVQSYKIISEKYNMEIQEIFYIYCTILLIIF